MLTRAWSWRPSPWPPWPTSPLSTRAWAQAGIRPLVPLPLSVFIAVGLALMARFVWRAGGRWNSAGARHGRAALAAGAVAWALLFPLAQELFFGTTDYVRPAVAIVVLGAQVNADGSPSSALAGRVQEAAELYRQGRARGLLLSGGGAAQVDAMRRLGSRPGSTAGRLRLDPGGLNGQDTVNDTTASLGVGRGQPLLIMSDCYRTCRASNSPTSGPASGPTQCPPGAAPGYFRRPT